MRPPGPRGTMTSPGMELRQLASDPPDRLIR